MATVNKTANESNESKLINDNESNDLNDHQHSETSEDQLIKNEMEGMEEEESEDELSVGSPDEQAEQEMSTTAALRILRKRKNSDRNESDNEDDDDDKPLDFTKKIEGGENNYFLPFKKLEMTTEQNDQKSKKRGVAGFSIDDILSHKTKELKEKEKQQNQINPNSPPSGQPIVRPWDIVAASGPATAPATSPATLTNMPNLLFSSSPSTFANCLSFEFATLILSGHGLPGAVLCWPVMACDGLCWPVLACDGL